MAVAKTVIIPSLKLILMSSGVVFIALVVSLSLPSISSSHDLPSLFSSLKSWLQPPYLYVIINVIILTIAFSSRLQHHHHHPAPPPKSDVISVRADQFSSYDAVSVAGGHVGSFSPKPDVFSVRGDRLSNYDAGGQVGSFSPKSDVISVRADQFSPYAAVSVAESQVGLVSPESDAISVRADQFSPYDAVSAAGEQVSSFFGAVSVADIEVVEEKRSVGLETVMEDEVADLTVEKEEEKLTVDERPTWSVPRQQGLRRQEPVEFSLSEKPLVTSRFGHHRKHAKLSPVEGGKALRVTKPKNKHDTFESTWKAITEGRHVPLTRHIKNKSDTWQYQGRQINLLEDPIPPPKPVKKSETFNDRTNQKSPPVVVSKLKKEPSLGQDELNRRVEAFINKFNEEMRLQRQQSMQQFLEKINRAA